MYKVETASPSARQDCWVPVEFSEARFKRPPLLGRVCNTANKK